MIDEQPTLAKAPPKKYLKLLQIFGTIIALLLFGYLLSRLDWETAFNNIRHMPQHTIPLALSLFLVGQWMNALRWYFLLRAQKVEITAWRTFQVSMCGAFASNFLPSTIGGDSLRFAFASIWSGKPVMALASVIFDRILNLMATLTFLPFAMIFLRMDSFQTILSISVGSLPNKIGGWVKKMVKKALDALEPWRKQPMDILKAAAAAWLGSFVVMLGVWIVSRGLLMSVTLSEVFAVSSVAYLISLLPISISGLGIREITVTALYMRLGVSAEQATALALINRILSTGETLLGAFWIRTLLEEISTDNRKKAE